jgi:hypothetical protein
VIASPVRLDRLQLGLFRALGSALAPAQVGWSYGQGAFDAMPGDLVNLTMTSMGPATGSGRRVILPFDALTLTIDGAPLDQRQIIRVNGVRFVHDVGALDTPETIAQAQALALAGDPANPWTATQGPGPTEVTITPDGFGSVWDVSIRGDMSVSSKVSSGAAALLTEGHEVCSVTIQTFSKGRELRDGAWVLASRVIAALRAVDSLEVLAEHGIAVSTVGAPVDISGLSGANWETRCTLDADLVVSSAFSRPIDTIEAVELGITFSDQAGELAQVVTVITEP